MDTQISEENNTTQTPVQNGMSEQIGTPEKAQKSSLSIVVVILVCFLFFGAGGYFLGRNTSPFSTSKDNMLGQEISPTNVITHMPSDTPLIQTSFGPESMWNNTEGKTEAFLKDHVILQTPSGWKLSDCGNSINFHPTFEGCATEPNRFVINVSANSPYEYQSKTNTSDIIYSNHKENILIGGKPAAQFDFEWLEGQGKGKYKQTVIFYSEDSYLYVTLNDLNEEESYASFLGSIRFN